MKRLIKIIVLISICIFVSYQIVYSGVGLVKRFGVEGLLELQSMD